MKFGLVLLLLVVLNPLVAQNCVEVDMGSIQYFENDGRERVELISYFVPCKETSTIAYTLPNMEDVAYDDPVPGTEYGIVLALLRDDPGSDLITVQEFDSLLYRGVNGQAVFFTDPDREIQVSDLIDVGNESNEFVLMPVLVSNFTAADPSEWFEDSCVHLNSAYSLTIVEFPAKDYEFPHFDQITFTNWPIDVPITDYLNFTFTDQMTNDSIDFEVVDNRSFRLSLPKPEGILRFEVGWKNHECASLELGVIWEFPTIELRMDTMPGYRNIEKCVPVRAFNFESVTSFQFSLFWESEMLDFMAIKNIHPSLESYLNVSDINPSGDLYKIDLSFSGSPEPITFPDSTILFEWCGKPMAEAGELVEMDFSNPTSEPSLRFFIQGQESESEGTPGGIWVQEDREIVYDLVQLCNTRDGRHRTELDIVNDEAYPYTYSFHSELVPDSVVRSIPFLIPDVPPGQYQFTIRDSFGFEITDTILVQESVSPGFELEINNELVKYPNCINPFGGQIGISVSPDGQSYQFDLLNDDADFIGDSVSGLVSGTYVIEAENEAHCIDTIHFTLPSPEEIQVSWNAGDLLLCPGQDDVVLQIDKVDPTNESIVEFQLDGGEVGYVGTDRTRLEKPGIYELHLWNEDGCTLDTIVTVRSAPDSLIVWDTTSIQILMDDTVNFHSPVSEDLTDVEWIYNEVTVGDEEGLRFQPRESGFLQFKASVHDRCFYEDSLMIRVVQPQSIAVEHDFPNAFSPNADGINDVFTITPSKDIQRINRMEVFDRYGNFVFVKNFLEDDGSIPDGWDGRQAGVDSPPGIYAVQIEVVLRDGREEQMGLEVLLLR